MVEYGSFPAPAARGGHIISSRHSKMAALTVGVLCGVVALVFVAVQRGASPSTLLGWERPLFYRTPALAYRLDTNPWDKDPREMQWGNSLGYGFEPDEELSDPLTDGWPLFSPQACTKMPFDDMPAGYLCSSPRYGVYALDPYGNMYNRRIQHRVKDKMQQETVEISNVVASLPVKKPWISNGERHFHWVSPLSWVEPALLPNQTESQSLIESFYEAISSPMTENLTNATEFLSDKFEYTATKNPLTPGCVPDVLPGQKLEGQDDWLEAMGRTVDSFGNITSSLVGNATCTPDRQKDILRPLMFCVAKHSCTFELKSMTNSSGLPVTLSGEMVDSIWINSELQIEKIHTHFNPKHFHQLMEDVNLTAAA